MRLGISKNLKHQTPMEWAKKHYDLGLRCINFPWDFDSPVDLLEYKKAAEKYDLTIAELGIWKPLLCLDEKQRKENIDFAVSELQFADEIGAKCCVDFIGTYKGIRTENSDLNFTEEAYQATVETIKEILNRANVKNTKFALEAMGNMTPWSPEHYVKLINDVNHPQFGVHLDVFNWVKDEKMLLNPHDLIDKCFDLLGDKIISCHLKDLYFDGEKLNETMCFKGQFDIKYFLDKLVDYPDMPVIIEHLQTTEEYLEAIELFKTKYKNPVD